MRRVVITGAGAITPLGLSASETMAAMAAGRCAIGPLEIPDAERLQIRIGAQVKGFEPSAHFPPRALSLLDRFAQFALVAADEAVVQAGITFEGALAGRSGVVIGSAGGGLGTSDDNYRTLYEQGRDRVHPFVVPRLMHNAAASQISIRHGLRGLAFSVATACASSNHAIGQAFHLIRSGGADAMLAGGAEAMLCLGGIKAWEGLRVLSPDGCRPFSAERNGLVLGEGAAVFVLEEYEHARARGAEILAEIAGFAMTSDAQDMVQPSREGAARAIAGALADASMNPSDVGYVNAHGTGTAANDRVECAALADVFGPALERLPVSSTKSMHGHLIGAAGAVELLACLMALGEGVIAPTANFGTPDPDCPVDAVPGRARKARPRAVLSNAFAFGGLNAVLALRRV